MKKTLLKVLALGIGVPLVGACSVAIPTDFDGGTTTDPECTTVVVATSSEKVNLMEKLGEEFKDSPEAQGLSTCGEIYPINVASGTAASILMTNPSSWPDLEPELQPTIWSPASSIWVDRVAAGGNASLVEDVTSFTHTPIVFAMPETMAQALGYPETPISYADLEALIASPEGWGSVGKPLWGSFKIAKTNPNTSTVGLSTILAQSYAASGKTSDLTMEDVAAAQEFSRVFESGAIHYGDTTGKVLSTLYASQSSSGSSYVSAIALEETSLFWYNQGNPDSHALQEGETLTPPREKLVAVYPSDGSLWSDNPAVVLNAPWVTPEQREIAQAFTKFLNTKTAQELLPAYGFRPLDTSVDASSLEAYGIDIGQPTVTLPMPSSEVVSAALDQWTEIRKPSAVLELIDLSGSMNDLTADGSPKIEGAVTGAVATLDNFRKSDEIGVWAFTTDISSDLGQNVVPIFDFGALGSNKESLGTALEDLTYSARGGTPLYDSVALAYDFMSERAETGRINAIIVLSDGEDTDSSTSLESLLVKLNQKSEDTTGPQVRIFTIAYGEGADTTALAQISRATGGQTFDATDPTKIQEVFRSVINNF